MHKFARSTAPALLAKYSMSIGDEYTENRAANPKYQFSWPQRENIALYKVALEALQNQNDGHCYYCDGHPDLIDAHGEEQIDHFRPKSWNIFYSQVCSWDNLYLTCSRCNKAKLEKWSYLLLAPDEADYSFEKYFVYIAENGKIIPNESADSLDQLRAFATIEIFDLNRKGLCKLRQFVLKKLNDPEYDRSSFGHRYLHFLI